MYLQLPNNISLADLYLEDNQTIWFLIWILKKAMPCDRYLSEIILETPFQVIQDKHFYGYPRQYIQKNKKNHGLDRGWFLNGQLSEERHWKNGQKDGLESWWHHNSQLRWQRHWKNGQQDGLNRGWYLNGQLAWEEHWKNGQKHGQKRGWFNNGQLYLEEHWKNGQLDGPERGWNMNGKIYGEQHWRNGKLRKKMASRRPSKKI